MSFLPIANADNIIASLEIISACMRCTRVGVEVLASTNLDYS